jgi:hypothetical protein
LTIIDLVHASTATVMSAKDHSPVE